MYIYYLHKIIYKKYIERIYIIESEYENKLIELVDIDSLNIEDLEFITEIILKDKT